jgi:hypothetical protein
MHLTVIKPTAEITSLDLEHLPVWQLRMEVVPGASDDRKACLALGIRYLAPGTKDGTAFVQVLSINCKCHADDLLPVQRIGFPQDRATAKDRLKESLKVLYNAAMPAKDVDEILPKAGFLVDAYFDIRNALFGQDQALAAPGPVAKGELDGYRWAVTRKRFESWILAAGEDVPPAPGQEPEQLPIPEPPRQKKSKVRDHGTASVE